MDWISYIFGIFTVVFLEALAVVVIITKEFSHYMKANRRNNNESTDN